jgi:hypothetical protein
MVGRLRCAELWCGHLAGSIGMLGRSGWSSPCPDDGAGICRNRCRGKCNCADRERCQCENGRAHFANSHGHFSSQELRQAPIALPFTEEIAMGAISFPQGFVIDVPVTYRHRCNSLEALSR